MNFDELYSLLPTSWDNMTLNQYYKIIDIPISDSGEQLDGIDNAFKMISALCNISIEALEALPLEYALTLVKRLQFTAKEPDISNYKSSIQWKSIDEITYDNFVTLVSLQADYIHNMHTIIRSFTKNNYTEEEIINLSVMEVHAGFFTLTKLVQRYTQRSIRQTSIKLLTLTVKEKITRIRQKFNRRKIS